MSGILKKILVPILAVLLTVVLGVGLLLSGLMPVSISLSNGDSASASESEKAAPAQPPEEALPYYQPPQGLHELNGGGIFYEVGQRIVNLSDGGGFRFLRISIVLDFLPDSPEFYTLEGDALTTAEDEFRANLERQRPIIDNVITDVLTSKSFEEVFTVEGKEVLREQIREELNAHLRNRYVQQVLLTDFVIQ